MKTFTKCAQCRHQSVTEGGSFSSEPCPVCGGTTVNIEMTSGKAPDWFLADRFLYVPEFTGFSILAVIVAVIAAVMGQGQTVWWALSGIVLDIAICALLQFVKWRKP